MAANNSSLTTTYTVITTPAPKKDLARRVPNEVFKVVIDPVTVKHHPFSVVSLSLPIPHPPTMHQHV